jgi:hypothetical protein
LLHFILFLFIYSSLFKGYKTFSSVVIGLPGFKEPGQGWGVTPNLEEEREGGVGGERRRRNKAIGARSNNNR